MNEREIFLAALRIDEDGSRSAYLDQACGSDRRLKDRIVSLLRSSAAAGSFMESPASAVMQAVAVADEMTPLQVAEPVAQQQIESGVLGDYRILREIGRGGMGVVYEAEQISLGRIVALKVLPYAAMLDKTQLARFKNEARAAASLDHPNVVHVHSVGSERGGHYYAMQYIEGRTVADLIAGEQRQRRVTPQPVQASERNSNGHDATEACSVRSSSSASPSEALKKTSPVMSLSATTRRGEGEQLQIRAIVRLAIQAANALEHAHQMGIVHRDIKPSNLLIDDEQHLWVADFGLALVEAEGSMTASGGMLGTLRYMSPEQIRGDRRVLNHHTDIYSLGATLYEMLTLQPAFPERDASRLMQRILNDEPTAPRQINRRIPRDLETIVLKAMAKDHDDRFATARDMAADLQRFLDDEPIQAKPPGPIERAKKWANRHRAMVATAAVTLVVAMLVASLLLWNERSETLAALERETAQRRLAEEQKALATSAQKESDKNLSAALDAVSKLLQHASNPNLREVPQVQPVRQEILQDVLVFYQQFQITTGDSAPLRFRAAKTWASLAELARDIGNSELAHQCFRTSLVQLEHLSRNHPENWSYQDCHMETLLKCGWHHQHDNGNVQESRKYFDRVRRRAEYLLSVAPADQPAWMRKQLCMRQVQSLVGAAAIARHAGDWAAEKELTVTAYRKAHEIDLPYIKTHLERGMAKIYASVDPAAGDRHFRNAVRLSRQITEANPTRERRASHARLLLDAAEFFRRQDPDTSGACVVEAVEIGEVLVSEFPTVLAYRDLYLDAVEADLRLFDLEETAKQQLVEEYLKLTDRWSPDSSTCVRIGMFLQKHASLEQALERFDRALQLDPGDYLAHYCKAEIDWDRGRYAEAIAGFTKAVELNPRHAWGWCNRGKVFMNHLQRYQEALADFDRAIELQQLAKFYQPRAEVHFRLKQFDKGMADLNMALEREPNRSSISHYLNGMAWNLATVGDSASDHSDVAVRLAERATELAPENASYWNTLGVAQHRDGQWSAALESLNKSMELRSGGDSYDWFFVAMALCQLDQREEARRSYEKAVSWTEENRPDDAELQRFRAEAAKLLQIEGE